MKVSCHTCRATFQGSRTSKFCSRACFGRAAPERAAAIAAGRARNCRPRRTLVCATCSASFLPKTNSRKGKYCSRKCFGESVSQRRRAELAEIMRVVQRLGVTPEAREKAKVFGESNPAWRGGIVRFRSIKHVRCPTSFLCMARKDGYVAEHRLKVAQALGRALTRAETVHHENHNSSDNALENLSLFKNNRDHKLYEAHGKPEPVWRGKESAMLIGSVRAVLVKT